MTPTSTAAPVCRDPAMAVLETAWTQSLSATGSSSAPSAGPVLATNAHPSLTSKTRSAMGGATALRKQAAQTFALVPQVVGLSTSLLALALLSHARAPPYHYHVIFHVSSTMHAHSTHGFNTCVRKWRAGDLHSSLLMQLKCFGFC